MCPVIPRLFLMKPHSHGFDEITMENIVVSNLEAEKVGGGERRHSDVFLHSEIFKSRPDVNSVIQRTGDSTASDGVTHLGLSWKSLCCVLSRRVSSTELVELSGKAKPAASATEEAKRLFELYEQELRGHESTLDNTVRTRLWGKDRESRNLGSTERVKILFGKARSASSSLISRTHLDSDGRWAIDLLAMRPSRPDLQKKLNEYEPPIALLRYLIYYSIVVLSGVIAVFPTLEEQITISCPASRHH